MVMSRRYKIASWVLGGLFVMFATLFMLSLNYWLLPVSLAFQVGMLLAAKKGERLERWGK